MTDKCAESKQSEIDDLKAQLKAVHESRIEFVEYCRKIESGDFVLVPKEPTDAMLIAADNCVISGKVTAHNVYKAMLEAARGGNE
ncbi:MAG: hypothetical protein RIQ74_923 [Pseudomonadota bacterium]|jgi:hypothetical protein